MTYIFIDTGCRRGKLMGLPWYRVDLVTAATELGHPNATTTANIYIHQVARTRAEAGGIRAGVFPVLKRA